ncbi:hypothetical protein BXA16_06000 [Salmonella enterica subsp. enterica serovar Typhimurium]|nr:hypothetical protein BXA16_06000 [Salmonella enterica subsp. enterica serovar Typhimurium]
MILMNALTAVKANTDDLAQRHTGFTLAPSAQSPRLLALTFTADTTKQFLHQVAQWPVQALEYKSFLRFKIGKILDDLCGNQLQPLLIKTLLNRAQGALLISAEGIDDVAQAEEMVKLATAVAHLIGRSNYDAMSGQYYARFVVKNVDNSDSYLRQPHRVMELHNDGTYVEEVTDYVLMMKIDEQNMEGGNSLLLHLDDWEHLESFFTHPLARRVMRWAAPPSKNVSHDVWHPVFDVDQQGRPVMRYIDQFVQPNMQLIDVYPDARIALLEKESAPACHQTGHNSGVIHAGVYYTPGSLKAQFCLAGNQATKTFCDQNNIRYDTCGKMLVATSELEMARMRALWERTAANGLEREWLSAAELREREPNIIGLGGIFVPSSGIVSYRDVATAMANRFQAKGGEIIYHAEVSALTEHAAGVVIRTSQGREIETATLIGCAGLMADRLVKMLGVEPGFIICPFRGEYFRLAPRHNRIVNHLIYPIPDPAMPFLGVHLTRMIDGSVTVGPNAVLALKREGYRKRDVSFTDTLEIFRSAGIRRVLQNHLLSGLGEMKNSLCKSGYLRRVQKYCPSLTVNDLQPWPAGVRAQAVSPDGKLIDDFLFVTTPRSIHTCNAPSPAATSAIPIGAHIVSKVQALRASQSNPGRTLRAARSVDALHAAFTR